LHGARTKYAHEAKQANDAEQSKRKNVSGDHLFTYERLHVR
jgi:hypothetical protein